MFEPLPHNFGMDLGREQVAGVTIFFGSTSRGDGEVVLDPYAIKRLR
jgi:hypothetical protein